jgi:hypothetical protein
VITSNKQCCVLTATGQPLPSQAEGGVEQKLALQATLFTSLAVMACLHARHLRLAKGGGSAFMDDIKLFCYGQRYHSCQPLPYFSLVLCQLAYCVWMLGQQIKCIWLAAGIAYSMLNCVMPAGRYMAQAVAAHCHHVVDKTV